MNKFSAARIGRKGRIGLALGAATIAGLTILGGAAAANAAPTPAPGSTTQDAVLDTGPAPDLSGVPQFDATIDPETGPVQDAILEDGPAPDLSGVPHIELTIAEDGTTAKR